MRTRVAAEGQFPCGCVGLSDVEIPVFVDPHRGGVRVPAGVCKQEVLEAGQHLRRGAEDQGVRIRIQCISSYS